MADFENTLLVNDSPKFGILNLESNLVVDDVDKLGIIPYEGYALSDDLQKQGIMPYENSKILGDEIMTQELPVPVDDTVQTLDDVGVFNITGLLDNDLELVGPETISAVTQPPVGEGTVAINPDGVSVDYTLSAFQGITSFTYDVDNSGSPATVMIDIISTDLMAIDDDFDTMKGVTIIVNVLSNDQGA